MKTEVQQLRMDIITLKDNAISSEISTEVRSSSNNIIMMGVQDEREIRKVIQFLEVDVTEVDMKIKTISSSRPLKPFIVSFADDKGNSWSELKIKAENESAKTVDLLHRKELTINMDKTKFVLFFSYRCGLPAYNTLEIKSEGITTLIDSAESIQYSGVEIDSHLSHESMDMKKNSTGSIIETGAYLSLLDIAAHQLMIYGLTFQVRWRPMKMQR
ncbi:hypothetical protein HHI36_001772 [Cryptolaemus montrouzieri]|uniref:Uncharacterized protein n=1 Tax=Cryptolaemus montrouzieri TaxID=559131 RepID=A0ABD2P985_9CUCU